LWSLASGGYSIGILHYIESFAGDQFEFELRRLEQIGAGKQEARLRGIRRLGLVEEREGRFSLTKVGATCAAVLTALGWSLNVREGG
jgi:hypothetical protein